MIFVKFLKNTFMQKILLRQQYDVKAFKVGTCLIKLDNCTACLNRFKENITLRALADKKLLPWSEPEIDWKMTDITSLLNSEIVHCMPQTHLLRRKWSATQLFPFYFYFVATFNFDSCVFVWFVCVDALYCRILSLDFADYWILIKDFTDYWILSLDFADYWILIIDFTDYWILSLDFADYWILRLDFAGYWILRLDFTDYQILGLNFTD